MLKTKEEIEEYLDDPRQVKRFRDFLRWRSCVHSFEPITSNHSFIHPPECLICGSNMSPEERIKNGLTRSTWQI